MSEDENRSTDEKTDENTEKIVEETVEETKEKAIKQKEVQEKRSTREKNKREKNKREKNRNDEKSKYPEEHSCSFETSASDDSACLGGGGDLCGNDFRRRSDLLHGAK